MGVYGARWLVVDPQHSRPKAATPRAHPSLPPPHPPSHSSQLPAPLSPPPLHQSTHPPTCVPGQLPEPMDVVALAITEDASPSPSSPATKSTTRSPKPSPIVSSSRTFAPSPTRGSSSSGGSNNPGNSSGEGGGGGGTNRKFSVNYAYLPTGVCNVSCGLGWQPTALACVASTNSDSEDDSVGQRPRAVPRTLVGRELLPHAHFPAAPLHAQPLLPCDSRVPPTPPNHPHPPPSTSSPPFRSGPSG